MTTGTTGEMTAGAVVIEGTTAEAVVAAGIIAVAVRRVVAVARGGSSPQLQVTGYRLPVFIKT